MQDMSQPGNDQKKEAYLLDKTKQFEYNIRNTCYEYYTVYFVSEGNI